MNRFNTQPGFPVEYSKLRVFGIAARCDRSDHHQSSAPFMGYRPALCIHYSSSHKQFFCNQRLLGVDHDAISTTFGDICFRSSEALRARRFLAVVIRRNQLDWGGTNFNQVARGLKGKSNRSILMRRRAHESSAPCQVPQHDIANTHLKPSPYKRSKCPN